MTSPPQEPASPSAAIWSWRGEDDARRAAGERAAARRRGWVQAGVGFAAAALLSFWRPGAAWVVAGLALLTVAAALASPLGLYRRLTRGVLLLGRAIATLLTWIVLPILYWLLFFPFGALLRLQGKLGFARAFTRGGESYWSESPRRDGGLADYERQF